VADYSQQWKTYRLRRNWTYGVLLGVVPMTLLLRLLPTAVAWADYVKGAAMIVWFVLFVCWGTSMLLFRCPRCKQSFSSTGYRNIFFSPRCINCGLEKYSNG
jgi:hypothetical protein